MYDFLNFNQHSRKKLGRENTYYHFIEKFLKHDAHHWIIQDRYIQSAFEEFFSQLPLRFIESFSFGKFIVFVPSNGKYGCTVSSESEHVVIIFPELQVLLKSTVPETAFGVLAHELGHIFAQHNQKDMDPLRAQLEADRIACEMGFAKELQSFLVEQDRSTESFTRLSHLIDWQLKN